ncbi:MAG: substrate-binding domain-containing protein, partial [Rubrimonas sp.]
LGGAVRLGALDAMVGNPDARIAEALAAFAERAPACAVRLVCRPPDELLRDVLGGAMDAAVGSFPRVALGLDYETLFEERQSLYAGRGHPLFDMADEAVDHDAVAGCRIVARSYWGARDVRGFASARVGAEVQDMESEAHLILSGAFLGHLPDHYAAQWVAAGRMRALAPGRFGYRAPFQIAVRPDRAAEPRVAALLDCLRAAHGR